MHPCLPVAAQVPHGRTLWSSGFGSPRAAPYMAMACAMPPPPAGASFGAPQRRMLAMAPTACYAAACMPCAPPPPPMAQSCAAPGGGRGGGGGGVMKRLVGGLSDKLFSGAAAPAPAIRQAAAPVDLMGCDESASMRCEEEDEDKGGDVDLFGDAPAAMEAHVEADDLAPLSAPPSGRLADGELLSFLNLTRSTEGAWPASDGLATALGLPAGALAAAAGGEGLAAQRPVGLSDEAWATLLVLAALRARLASRRDTWADMEAKALAWLARHWPAGARSAGLVLMGLAKSMAADA
jgi:hypothetical protein